MQAVISGIATSVTIYATTHPKFIAFKDNLKKIGYATLHKRLVKAGLDDSAIDEFCKKFGVIKETQIILTNNDIRKYLIESTHNSSSKKVMLGLYDGGAPSSYISKAGNEYTFFP